MSKTPQSESPFLDQHSPARVAEGVEQPWQRTRREVLIEAAMKCRDIQYEHRGLLYENAEPNVKTYHDGMAKGADVCEYAIRNLAESPAKEQPGEQNATWTYGTLPYSKAEHSDVPGNAYPPAAAAPDVAAMVKRLREGVTVLDEPFHRQAISDTMEDAAALIEKLGADLEVIGTVIRTGFVPPAREWTSEIARKTALRALELRQVSDAMVNRFLTWPLPESVDSDVCVTKDYGQRDGWVKVPLRYGTNLLTADEARQMLEYVLLPPPPERP